MWKGKGSRIAFLNNEGEISLSNFKIYCTARVIKTVWYWWRDRHRSMETNGKPRN